MIFGRQMNGTINQTLITCVKSTQVNDWPHQKWPTNKWSSEAADVCVLTGRRSTDSGADIAAHNGRKEMKRMWDAVPSACVAHGGSTDPQPAKTIFSVLHIDKVNLNHFKENLNKQFFFEKIEKIPIKCF